MWPWNVGLASFTGVIDLNQRRQAWMESAVYKGLSGGLPKGQRILQKILRAGGKFGLEQAVLVLCFRLCKLFKTNFGFNTYMICSFD